MFANLPLGTCHCLFYGRKACSLNWPLIGAQNLRVSTHYHRCNPHYISCVCTLSYESSNSHAATVHVNHHSSPLSSNLRSQFCVLDDSTSPYRINKLKTGTRKPNIQASFQKEGFSDLEFEILQFMETSDKPLSFPTKSELLRAGRLDLVDAILMKGGWLVAGWDSEPGIEEKVQKLHDTRIDSLPNKIVDICVEASNRWVGDAKSMEQDVLGSDVDHPNMIMLAADSREGDCGSTAARNQPIESTYALNSVDRQRGWERVADLFGLTHSPEEPGHGGKTLVLDTHKNQKTGAYEISVLSGKCQLVGQVHFSDDSLEWSTNSLQPPTGGGQSLDTIPWTKKGKKKRRRISPGGGSADNIVNQTVDRINEKVNRRKDWLMKVKLSSHKKSDGLQQDRNNDAPISCRIHVLEAELISTLNMLQSGRHALAHDNKSKQINNVAITEIEEASDALEFRETELMNKCRELRKVRAQLTASEGKLALELMEARKSIEEKDKRLVEAMKVLKMMRTARIVWPNPASEVFLSGSFDGWTSRRKMQKSSAGVFVTALQLYPGRYEIKFIVDGEWRVDPNRPIIRVDGFENNVLNIV